MARCDSAESNRNLAMNENALRRHRPARNTAIRRGNLSWLAIATLVGGILLPQAAWAQPGGLFGQNNNQQDEDLFLLAPRALVRLLREGEQAIADKRFSEGITSLSLLLKSDAQEDGEADLLGQDYFLEPKKPGYYTKSIKGEAIRLLSELPEEGRRSLEIQFGVTARQALDAAVAERDFTAVADVARNFIHTEAGYDALVLAAQYKLASGYPLAAASLLQSMLDYPAARQRYGVQLASAAALAMRQAGRKDIAIATMKRADRDFAGAEIKVAGRSVRLGAGADWTTLVDELSTQMPLTDNMLVDAWMTSGGTPERNATNTVGMPLANARWDARIHGSSKEEEVLNAVAASARQQRKVILPKFELRIVNDLVLSKTTDNAVFAHDFGTGQLKWRFYFHSAPIDLNNGFPSSVESGDASDSVSDELKNRVWGSSAFGNFSCDSQRFYFVSSADEQPINSTAMFNFNRSAPASTNYLEGAGLASEGSILWRVGGAKSAAEPKLAGAYFLGPPLPFEDQLYTLLEINGETRLAVLDPTNGQLLWQQQLLQTQFAAANQDPGRRAMALTPTISDGVIVCPTGYGALVAVDMQTRSLRWAKTYRSTRENRDSNLNAIRGSFRGDDGYDPLDERWHEPMAIAHQGVVLVTPPDSNLLICLDILTGESKWKSEGERRLSGRYIVGVNNEHVVMAGNAEVYAYRLDGEKGWQLPFPKGQTLAGKGIWQGSSMLIPLSNQQVIKVDTKTGKLLETATVDKPLGNLFAYKEQLLSVSPTVIAVYYTRDSLERDVQARLAKDPNDTWALNQQSQLTVAAGKLPEAIELLERSYKIDPNQAETRFLLAETLLKAFESDFDRYQPIAEKYEEIFELSQQPFRYLQSLALGNVRSKLHYAAFERLLDLMRARLSENFSSQQRRRDMLTIAPGHLVDSDAWIATQLARTFSAASSDEQTKMRASIVQGLESVENSMLTTRRQLLRYFAWLPDAASSVYAISKELITNDTTMAERMIQPALLSDVAAVQARAAELLFNNPIDDWLIMGPYGTYSTNSRDPNTKNPQLSEFSPSRPALRIPAADMSLEELQQLKPVWPTGMLEFRKGDPGAPVNDIETIRSSTGPPLSGPQYRYGRPGFSVRLLGSTIIIVNELGQRVKVLQFERATSDGLDAFARCQVNGGLILIETASELLAVDLYRQNDVSDSLLWRHSLLSPTASPFREASQASTASEQTALGFTIQKRTGSGRQSVVGPLTPAGVIVQTATVVSLLDSMTGAVIWSRDGFSDQTRFASNGLEVAVVEPSTGTVQILDCRDGFELRSMPFKGDWQHWFAHGPWMVDFKMGRSEKVSAGLLTNADNPNTVRVWNVFTGENLQQFELPARSRATVAEDRFVVMLEPTAAKSGKLHFLDLDTQQYAVHEVERDANLDALQALRFDDRLIVFSFDMKEWREGGVQAKSVLQNMSADHAIACGMIYGLQVKDGSQLWKQSAKLNNYFVPKIQPRSSPYLVAYRAPVVQNVRADASVGLVLVDLRDASLAFADDAISVPSIGPVAIAMDPVEHKITVRLGATDLQFTATESERPPQPIFHFGNSRRPLPAQSFPIFGN